jgi:hypothetical protein
MQPATMGVRARTVRVRVLNAANPAALETALQAFLGGLTEEILLSIQYGVLAGDYSALVTFTR